jgi:glycosyltransferase involved in cell wall biosynthesis
MTTSTQRRRATAVTWLHDHQVGYLDFVYRLQALARVYDLTVISRRPLTEPELALNANIVVYRPTRTGSAGLAWYWARVARHLRALPGHVIVHLCSHTAAVASLPLGAPQVVYWNEHPSHYLDSSRSLRRWVAAAMRALQYRGARSARLVLPIGQAHRDDLLAHGCHPNKVMLQAMGVADWFANTAPAPQRFVPVTQLRVVYTGSVHADRGRDVMIDAVALARASGVAVHLTVIGADAQQTADCQARSQQQGVVDALTVLPRIPGDQIPGHLAQADFGVCLWADKPYWRFNPPTKLFEYLVAGLPVMASNIRTHTAYLRDGQDGYIFDYNAASLAATFCKAWRERERWPELRRQALEQGQPYRWSEIEPVFLNALKALTP